MTGFSGPPFLPLFFLEAGSFPPTLFPMEELKMKKNVSLSVFVVSYALSFVLSVACHSEPEDKPALGNSENPQTSEPAQPNEPNEPDEPEKPAEIAKAPEIVLEEPTGGFEVDKMQWFRLEPQVRSQSPVDSLWTLDGEEISTQKNVVHVFAEAGIYTLTLIATNEAGQSVRNISVNVRERNYSNWTNKVYDFVRAPGQHANAYPTIPPGSTYADVLDIVNTSIVSKNIVSLGAYGGYIVMGFDHTLINGPGNDFLVHGNAFAGFAEPGVIEVSWDANGNGLPDDPWYEIAGSEYNAATALRNYRLTYYNPATDTAREPGATGTRWTDNQGNFGYFPATRWPSWLGDTLEVGGSKYENLNPNGSLSTAPFAYGYADNWPNGDLRAQIDVEWAVDANGNPVQLKGIDFVKVYTGVFAHAGALGEISTEVTGVEDLHL